MKKLLLICLIFSISTHLSKAQTTINLTPIQDNSIYSGFTSNSNGIGPSIFSGTPGSGNPNRALLLFDIAGNIPSTATITDVVLTLNCEARGGSSIGEDHTIHYVTTEWGEGPSLGGGSGGGGGVPAIAPDATWLFGILGSTPWLNAGGDFISVPSATTNVGTPGTYTWTGGQLHNDVQLWLDNPAMNFGWLLKISTEGISGTSSRWTSREGNPSNVPVLAVTYTDLLSISEENINSLRVYPNPTKGIIRIDMNPDIQVTQIKIFNLLGQEIFDMNDVPSDFNALDFSTFNSGIYILEISSSEGSIIKRIIKD